MIIKYGFCGKTIKKKNVPIYYHATESIKIKHFALCILYETIVFKCASFSRTRLHSQSVNANLNDESADRKRKIIPEPRYAVQSTVLIFTGKLNIILAINPEHVS